MKPMTLLTAALLVTGRGTSADDFELFNNRPRLRERKNKYDLSPEEIEAMKTMTPKEKKKFLKVRNDKRRN